MMFYEILNGLTSKYFFYIIIVVPVQELVQTWNLLSFITKQGVLVTLFFPYCIK